MIEVSFWTEPRVDQLKSLWSEGRSAAEIFRELGAKSRSAVIGKLHRLGLSDLTRADVLERKVHPPRRTANLQCLTRGTRASVLRQVTMGNLVLKAVKFDARHVEVSTEYQKPLLSLRNDSCRYPVSDEGPHIFCGVPEADFNGRKPYCSAHTSLARRA
jgi:GcrA cell cycle regulator